MVFVHFGIFAVHIPWIPLATERRHRVNAPMDEDAELCVLVPLGNFIFLKRFPIGAEWTLVTGMVHFREGIRTGSVVLGTGLLPIAINHCWFLRGRGGGWRI